MRRRGDISVYPGRSRPRWRYGARRHRTGSYGMVTHSLQATSRAPGWRTNRRHWNTANLQPQQSCLRITRTQGCRGRTVEDACSNFARRAPGGPAASPTSGIGRMLRETAAGPGPVGKVPLTSPRPASEQAKTEQVDRHAPTERITHENAPWPSRHHEKCSIRGGRGRGKNRTAQRGERRLVSDR